MKSIYTIFLIFIIMTGPTITLSFGSLSNTNSNSNSNTADERNSNLSNKTDVVEGKFNNNSISPTVLSTDKKDKDKGFLIVNVTTLNGKMGINTSSDFIVNIHANNPIPESFNGNSTGTIVKLSMGMYSVTMSSIPNYNSSFLGDCNGGIMNIETKICNIVNIYVNDN